MLTPEERTILVSVLEAIEAVRTHDSARIPKKRWHNLDEAKNQLQQLLAS